jgi:hypothetical protein
VCVIYRECLAADQARLREVAAGDLTAQVPSCPEWTVGDLVRHLGTVYLHKVECMRLGAAPSPWPPPELATEEPLALLDRAYRALIAEFDSRDDGSAAFTWSHEPAGEVDAMINGSAPELLRWRRSADEVVLREGDPDAVHRLRRLLGVATQ